MGIVFVRFWGWRYRIYISKRLCEAPEIQALRRYEEPPLFLSLIQPRRALTKERSPTTASFARALRKSAGFWNTARTATQMIALSML